MQASVLKTVLVGKTPAQGVSAPFPLKGKGWGEGETLILEHGRIRKTSMRPIFRESARLTSARLTLTPTFPRKGNEARKAASNVR
jgi:hypothetical protein